MASLFLLIHQPLAKKIMSLGLCYPTHRRDLHLFIQLMTTADGSQTNRLTDSPFLTSHRTLPILRLSPLTMGHVGPQT
jgi:hypothetical protein